MSDLLTADQLRQHVETALGDEALERLLEKNEDVILEWAGPLGFDDYEQEDVEVSETVFAYGRTRLPLHQPPKADGIVSVTDYYGSTGQLVAATDYTVRGHYVVRAWGAAWGAHTVVVYVPMDSRARRAMALADLCKLDINHEPGMQSESAGPWSQSQADYDTEKDRILTDLWQPEPFA